MKDFCVIGLGNFGAMVARQLAQKGGKVTAIDIDKAKVQTSQEYTNLSIMGDATERKFLENLQIDSFACFVVSTGEDSHASILICLYLKELGAKKIVVKANSRDHARILKKVGADEAVIPEEEMAVKVAHGLAQPNVLDYLPLGGAYSIAEIRTPARFQNKSIAELKLRQQYRIEVIAIKDSLNDEFNFIPEASYELKDNDILIVLGRQDDIEKLKG